jgi:hypothetical protein
MKSPTASGEHQLSGLLAFACAVSQLRVDLWTDDVGDHLVVLCQVGERELEDVGKAEE